MRTVYLIGAPGSGKTTVMSLLLADMPETARYADPVKHTVHDNRGRTTVSLGWPRAPFGGTDTLGYTAITRVEALLLPALAAEGVNLLLGEGDRLATDRFLNAAATHGPVTLIHLDTPPDLAEARRQARANTHDLPPQNASWVAGRAAKALNLARRHPTITIPGDLTPEQVADTIRPHLQP